ncbi:serine/threonine-protein kinase Sgk2-like [Centruroides sculpturatus]|uniref:serine/threonine-protein kinase Sgk2-like n=1 Tax=Centruroides sculpturatus TaxID=218467 RepID=UPI000C6CA864|nr:serine/threonine-protein kinase Sgk2-like [Centruroides sculpturatus]
MFRCVGKIVLRSSKDKMMKKSRREDAEQNVQENNGYSFQNEKHLPAMKCDSLNKGESQLQANNRKKDGKFMGYLRNIFHKFLLCCCVSGEISDSETYEPKKNLADLNLEFDFVNEPKKFIDKYKITKEIARGRFGTVYLARTKFSEKEKAVKIVKKKFSNSDQFEEIQTELNVWNSVSAHPNIVRLIRFFQTDTSFCFVSDYVEGESLRIFLQKYGPIAESKAKVFAAQVASAIMYIHKNGNYLLNYTQRHQC